MDGMKSNPSFEKISEKLQTSFVQDTDEAVSQLQTIDERRQQIQKQVTDKKDLALRDQNYLLTEIKLLIQTTLSVLERLDQDIKVGTEARKFEVFAALTNSVTAQLKELRELNKMIADMEIFKDPDLGKPKTQINVEMDGRELLEYMDKIRAESEINKVEASFDIESNDPPGSED